MSQPQIVIQQAEDAAASNLSRDSAPGGAEQTHRRDGGQRFEYNSHGASQMLTGHRDSDRAKRQAPDPNDASLQLDETDIPPPPYDSPSYGLMNLDQHGLETSARVEGMWSDK